MNIIAWLYVDGIASRLNLFFFIKKQQTHYIMKLIMETSVRKLADEWKKSLANDDVCDDRETMRQKKRSIERSVIALIVVILSNARDSTSNWDFFSSLLCNTYQPRSFRVHIFGINHLYFISNISLSYSHVEFRDGKSSFFASLTTYLQKKKLVLFCSDKKIHKF
jgi:hypothetical protein